MNTRALTHAKALIRRPSVTPDDGGCQEYIASVLEPLGFDRTRVDRGEVRNSIFERRGQLPSILAYAGHTDVVPTGPLEGWTHPPFAAMVEDGVLHGRGAQDMKAGIACWLAAVEHAVSASAALSTLQLLITSDEEGESIDGTVRMVEFMREKGRLPHAAVVGEPSSTTRVGDTVRRGRRGVVHAHLTFKGKQGHSAYPQDAENAIHRAVPALLKLLSVDWGQPAQGFPPTSCQLTAIQGGEGASNVIPGRCTAFADIRYNPALDFATIRAHIEAACDGEEVELDIRHEAETYYTPDGPFLTLIRDCIHRITGMDTRFDTGGGTSDGRFLAAAGVPVVELGLTHDTIHQIGERVQLHELDTLTRIYADLIAHFGGIPCP